MNKPKFRAWDKSGNKMITWNRLLNGHNLRNVFMRPEMCGLILMQYTELKDVNDVEICQGDIVKVTDEYDDTNFSDGGIGSICGLDDLYMWYIDGQVHNSLFDIKQSYYIEVIGNIHENPELLNEVEK